jgi:general stress protein YciG
MSEKSHRGFAAMDQAKRRAIASKGGRAAHAKGTAHRFTPEEARVAGRKGGQAAHARGSAQQFVADEPRAQQTNSPPAAPASEIIGVPEKDVGAMCPSTPAGNLAP